MAKKSKENRVYSVTMTGLYFCHTGDGKEQKKYEETFRIDDDTIKQTGVRSSFARFWCPEFMPDKYPGYMAPATFNVADAQAEDGEPITNIELMNRAMLEQYIDDEELDIEIELYFDDDELREAIRTIDDDPTGFLQQQDLLAARRGQTVNVKANMLALNPKKSMTGAEPTPKEPAAKAKPAADKKGKAKTDDEELGV